MTARLAIETREVSAGEYHTYLVYQSDTGQPWEALHGFSGNGLGGGELVVFYDADLSNVSNSLAENDERGSTTAELNARGHATIETGQEATGLWNIMKQQLSAIGAAHLDYEFTLSANDQNSNATVASLLRSVGLNIDDYTPLTQSSIAGGEVVYTVVDNSDLPGYANVLLNVATTLEGSSHNDILNGSSLNDSLTGGGGADSITGGSGADTMNGGAGVDTLSYASASSAIHITSTGAGSSGITGGGSSGDANGDVFSGFEVYVGSAYNDEIDLHNTSGIGVNIYGGGGYDLIIGGSGDDILHGNDGADQLQGSAGDNFLIGDDGADQYYVGEDRGVDVISDEDGGEIILGSIDGGGTNVAFTGTADFVSGTTWKLLGHTLHLAFGDLTITSDDSSQNYRIIIDDYDTTQSNYFGFTLQDPHSGAGDDPEIGNPLDPNNPENAAHLGLDGVDDATGADGTLPWPDGTNFWRNDGDWGDDAPGISYFNPRADQVALDDEGHLFTPTLFERIFDAAIRTLANWTPGAADPLVLDLDNDGIELISLADSHAFFDIDSDNFDERTGWVGPDDALLVIDGNSNGTIDNIDELAAIIPRRG